MCLIFGCRSSSEDYYFKEEWPQYDNLKVITAFSRESPADGKVYVQHKIRENAAYIKNLLEEKKAWVFICGRAKFMPASVEKALQEVTSKEFIEDLKNKGLFQQEVW